MNNRADIGFFESLGTSGGKTVYYDTPIENGFWDRIKQIPRNLKTRWRLSGLALDKGDWKTRLAVTHVLAPLMNLQTRISQYQSVLLGALYDGSMDTGHLLHTCSQWQGELQDDMYQEKWTLKPTDSSDFIS